MQYHLECFISGRRNELRRKEIEVLVADDEFVLAALIPLTKTGSTHLVRHIKKVKPMRAPRTLE